MTKNRGSQRGVVKIASSLLLAGLGALLSVAGCAPEDGARAVTEDVGVATQALTCNKLTPCPTDTCTEWTCTLGVCVVVNTLTSDGGKCSDAEKNIGICAEGVCCTAGCASQNKLGAYTCRRGTELNFCGQPGTLCKSCAGSDRCTDYFCSEKQLCDSAPIPDGKACSDGSGICAKGACCAGCFDGGVCQPGNTAKLCGAGGAEKCQTCDDGNPCTDDACGQNGVCIYTAVEAGKSCDSDSNLCNGTAKCEGTVCKTAPAVVCNDGNPCTNDTCATATGQCVYTNNTANCSDGNVCTLVDKCSGGKCVGTGEPTCDDNNVCTSDSCDKTLGCQHAAVANNTPCDDGNGCSTGDQCKAGKCTASAGTNCDDDNPCTKDACAADICDPVSEPNGTACVYDKCHINSECQAGKCTQGEPLKCDDGNPCTTDSCDPLIGCKYVNVEGGSCSDGDLCTIEDKCSGGKCVGKETSCAPIDDCHLAGTCNAKTGTCDDPRAPDDTECGDGKGKCVTGKCDIPVPEGGAGGEGPTGQAGEAAGGTPTTGAGGEGNAPTSGGEGVNPAGGKDGTDGTGEAGEAVDPARIFQREPGGCSCNVPASDRSSLTWLASLGLAALVAARRRARSSAPDSMKRD